VEEFEQVLALRLAFLFPLLFARWLLLLALVSRAACLWVPVFAGAL